MLDKGASCTIPNMSKNGVAFVFPGQGSQVPGMGSEVYRRSTRARDVFCQVSSVLSRDVAKLCFDSDEEILRYTENAQVALFTVSVATYEAIKEEISAEPVAMAGHSVGEYSALVNAGWLTLEDGARLVARRGDLMGRAGALRKGAMSAVLGVDAETVRKVCDELSKPGALVTIANDNCPGQIVISGDEKAVELACERLKEQGAKRCIRLNVSGAFHSPLMQEAGEAFRELLVQIEFRTPSPLIPVVSNVTAEPIYEASRWQDLLYRQLVSPVRWTESIQKMHVMGINTFVECGSGEVLTGLIKRILPGARALFVKRKEDAVQLYTLQEETRK